MGMFDFDVLCIIGEYSKVNVYMKWKFEEKDFNQKKWDMEYEPRGRCFFKQGYVPVIWIPQKPRKPREYATLSHECIHATYHLFAWVGLPMSRDTEEVMTHATAHLINSILKNI